MSSVLGNITYWQKPVPLERFEEANARPLEAPKNDGLRLSIITPSLQRGNMIATALDSVAKAGLGDRVEHIVVDGGSSDSTLDVVASYPGVVVVSEPDVNSHDAMNKGIRRATGDIVGFLNTDDFYGIATLQHVLETFARTPDLQALRVPTILVEDGPSGFLVTGTIQPSGQGEEALWNDLLYGTPAFNTWFFRRQLLETLGGVNDKYVIAADRDLLLRAALNGVYPQDVDVGFYAYRQHRASATLDQSARNAEGILEEHMQISQSLSGQAGKYRDRLLDWGALEAYQLFRRLLRRGGLLRAMRLAPRVFAQALRIRRAKIARQGYFAQFK